MNFKTYNNRGTNGNKQGEIKHGHSFNESVEINKRFKRDYSNHEKAVTQPTPSSDSENENEND